MSHTVINRATEEALTDYLISYCDPLEMTASFYTGLGNVETLNAPAVMVSVVNGTALIPNINTKVADMTVTVTTKEMLADTASGSLGALALMVYNAMVDPNIVTNVKNANSWSFSPWGIYELDSPKEEVHQDAIYNVSLFRVVGALTGSA